MRHIRNRPSLLIVIALAQLLFSVGEAHAQYSLNWYTIDGGGNTATGGTYSLSSTAGQPDASNALTGGTYSLSGGFWGGALPAVTCLADIALPHNGVVNTDDLLVVITSWGSCPLPCPPNCPADIALPKNCAVNTDDLLLVITTWGACP